MMQFGFGPDAEQGIRGSGSFAGYGTLNFGGLANIPIGTADDPFLGGELTEDGLLTLHVGASLPEDLFGDQIGFAAGAQATLLVNLSDQPVTDPELLPGDQSTIAGYGAIMLVEGGYQVGPLTVDGTFRIEAMGDRFAILGDGSIDVGAYDALLGSATANVTLAGSIESVGLAQAFGGFFIQTGAILGADDSPFFDERISLAIAANTTTTERTVVLDDFTLPGQTAIVLPSDLQPLLTLPRGAIRLVAQGDRTIAGFGLSDALFVAQASPKGLDVGVSGQISLGLFGNVDVRGAFHAGPDGVAGQLMIDDPLQTSVQVGSRQLFSAGGTSVFEFNTTSSSVPVNLPDFADFEVANPGVRLRFGASDDPVILTIAEMIQLSGFGVATIEPDRFALQGGFGFSLDVPPLVPGLPDEITADADVDLVVNGEGIERASFTLQVDDEPYADARLSRHGCLFFDLFGAVNAHFDVSTLQPVCVPQIYIDDQVIVESGTTRLQEILVIVDPPAARDLELKLSYSNGTATAGRDYLPGPGSIVVPAGSREAKISIETPQRSGDNGVRDFQVQVTSFTPTNFLGLPIAEFESDPEDATITILDDDVPPLGPSVVVGVTSVGRMDVVGQTGNRIKMSIGENEGPALLRFNAPELTSGDSIVIGYQVVDSNRPMRESASLGDDFTLQDSQIVDLGKRDDSGFTTGGNRADSNRRR